MALGTAGTAVLFPSILCQAVWGKRPIPAKKSVIAKDGGRSITAGSSVTIEEIALEYEQATGGHVGIYAQNIATGKSLAWRANERFLMCSSFKVSLVASVLLRCDRGQDSLERIISYKPEDIGDLYAPFAKAHLDKAEMSVAELCQGAIEQSDNFCANKLLERSGGALALTAFWRQLGDNQSRLDHIEPFLNETPYGGIENTTTPIAMARNLQKMLLGSLLSPSSRDRLVGWMVRCQTGGQRLRAGLPKSWVIADKTGTNGHDAASDIAILWPQPDKPVIISVYVWGGTPTKDQLLGLFSKVAHYGAAELLQTES
ncbi:class A beta-lactamase [Zymomonas sp.]|uniref:class A beta-lactamase n=1 Tax=Zymomonas sp. TaxID=2068624 RepID=UPI0025D856A7|nr:class A beta-lactamase [Zymomonas sp.]MCA1956028.1 class A beta-lactamase [Zymomonas sp.]